MGNETFYGDGLSMFRRFNHVYSGHAWNYNIEDKTLKALTQIQVCKLSAFPLSPIQCWKDFNHDQHCQLIAI